MCLGEGKLLPLFPFHFYVCEVLERVVSASFQVWNGPMGVFEFDKFAAGTLAVANCLAGLTEKGSITIIGGGDSVRANPW